MTQNIYIKIADITTRLVCDEKIAQQITETFSSFLTKGSFDYSVSVHVANAHDRKLPFAAEASITDENFQICCEEFIGHVNLSNKEGVVYILSAWPFESLASFLRSFYSAIIVQGGGLMLHAAGIVKKGRAHIFFGPSESGKTTVSKNSPACSVLSDELIAIKSFAGRFGAYGTPYGKEKLGEASGPHPIAGFFKLVQDNQVFLKQFSHAKASTELLTIPRVCETFSAVNNILHITDKLTENIPCFELHFLPDDSFWRCIDEHSYYMPANF
jgi:hypothetical protein